MSRIYDALQRVELERKAAEGMNSSAEKAATISAAPAHNVKAGTPPGISFTAVTKTKWTPQLSELPALGSRGPEVEQFRSLRSRMFEFQGQELPFKSILISSGLPQEGKSFIAANLALSLARHKGNRVLLIDGDMRRPTLHMIFGCAAQPGLVEYLSGTASLGEVLQQPEVLAEPQVTKSNQLGDITLIAGGAAGDIAADLSGSERFKELISAAAKNFNWIIVDSSPVLPVSDAVNLARYCDGVLLVARAGVTTYPVAQRAVEELKSSNLLGFVLNAATEAPEIATYYGYDSAEE